LDTTVRYSKKANAVYTDKIIYNYTFITTGVCE